jgi:hypothetical protein
MAEGVGIEFETKFLADFSILYILVIGFIRRLKPKASDIQSNRFRWLKWF